MKTSSKCISRLLFLVIGLALVSCRKEPGSVPVPLPSGAWPELPPAGELQVEVGDSEEERAKIDMAFLAAVDADGIAREAEGSSMSLTLANSSSEEVSVIVMVRYQRVALEPVDALLEIKDDGAAAGTIPPAGRAVVRITAVGVGEPEEPGELIEIYTPKGVDRIEAWIAPLLGEWRAGNSDGSELDLGMVAVHAALVRKGDDVQAIFFSPPRDKKLDGTLRRRRDGDTAGGGYYWTLWQLNDVEIALWDMATGKVHERPMDRQQNLFCSGHAHLPNGQLLVVGGHVGIFGFHNADRLHVFDAARSSGWWRRLDAELSETRWYPSVTPLPDGKMLVTSGRGAPLLGNGLDHFLGWYRTARRTYEIFDPDSGKLVSMPEDEKMFLDDGELATYPSVHVLPGGSSAPDGLVFVQERANAWVFRYHAQNGGRLTRLSDAYPMVSKGSRSYPYYGSAVLLPFAAEDASHFRILVVGGQEETNDNHEDYREDQLPTKTVEMFDVDTSLAPDQQVGWRRLPSMGQARMLPSATLLADGTVFVSGGARQGWANCNQGDILVSELYDPESSAARFHYMAPAAYGRRYHSTAMLLPDGTLLSSGSTGGYNLNNECIQPEFVAERYYPSYLWKGPRPEIASLSPNDVRFGETWTLDVQSSELGGMRVALIRLASVTHGNNMDQRYVWLSERSRQPTPEGARLELAAPGDGTVASPGDYMLFAVDGAGVPSLARLVRVSK